MMYDKYMLLAMSVKEAGHSFEYSEFLVERKLKEEHLKLSRERKIIAKERIRASIRNYNLLKLINGTGLDTEQWKVILEKYYFRCAYCGILGRNTKQKYLTRDHVIPVNKGGEHSPENIVPACVSCNSRKCDNNGWVPKIYGEIDE